MLQHVVLPQAVFSAHPMLFRGIRTKDPMCLLHFGSLALHQCLRLGLITGEPDSDENCALLSGLFGKIKQSHEVECGHFVRIFTMPVPQNVTEAHFVGITQRIYGPDKDPLRYFLLEKSAGENPHLCERTAAGDHINYGESEQCTVPFFAIEIGWKLQVSDAQRQAAPPKTQA